ncbi:hypothetical protein BN14_03800 [Rhizoctonia solani AG-1 IB]|uniref:Uncharacterized protein n=1 Tax=Thanatephorus cucumeris (strain AG1-IB / isolate 7/3/14) TaxID=1108050 RepID=M5BTF7_THACB|nr:hypothetical protein BN14_03800 [Rhizoctonia solani AG-1 IB]
MSETVYNITIPNTSATLAYSPYVTDNAGSGGWQSLCPTYVTNGNGTNSWVCDPDSAHTTSSFKASFQLSFEGVGIHLIGNTTNSLGYDISLDGVHFPGNFRSNAQSLYSSVGLKPGQHTVSLTVRQPVSANNPGSVALKEVVVNSGTGRSGATMTKKVLDDTDPSITYYAPPGGNWTIGNAYVQATQPEGITSSTFHDSYWTNATATIAFKGVGISVYGACYSHSRYAAYSASMDGSEEIPYDGTINLYSIGGDVKQRAGNCLRYFKAGLDGDKDHELVLKVKDMGRLAVDWVEVFAVEGGNAPKSGWVLESSRPVVRQYAFYAWPIACANKLEWDLGHVDKAAARDSDTGHGKTAFRRRTSKTIVFFSYTESTGSGPRWVDSTGYQTTSFNYTTPLGTSMSRPVEYVVQINGMGSNPGEVYASGGPTAGGVIITEAGSSTGMRPGYQIYTGTMANRAGSSMSPAPPAYERVEAPEDTSRVSREKRVR